MKTTRAAKRACKSRGMAIAPCIAPLMKRNASGHLCLNQQSVISYESGVDTFEVSVL